MKEGCIWNRMFRRVLQWNKENDMFIAYHSSINLGIVHVV